jgi:hypothetical protein
MRKAKLSKASRSGDQFPYYKFVEEVMEDAGLKLLRIKLRPTHNIEVIENLKILLN